MTSEYSISRKSFLKISTQVALWLSGILGLGILTRYLSYEPDQDSAKSFDLGPITDLPEGQKTVYPDIPAVLIRSNKGFLALSLRCTHLGCTLEEDLELFRCPCHGSIFSADGTVITGPALDNLSELLIQISDEDHLIIHAEGGGP